MNCFLHFYLFQSVTSATIYSLVKHLLTSFKEDDLETLLFVLHNIGL
jgi:hypothetical protein